MRHWTPTAPAETCSATYGPHRCAGTPGHPGPHRTDSVIGQRRVTWQDGDTPPPTPVDEAQAFLDRVKARRSL